MLEGTQDIMGLIESTPNSGGLWTLRDCLCLYLFSTALSSLSLFPSIFHHFFIFSFFSSSTLYFFFLFRPSSPVLTQLHQLRRHMSATVIMPSEGTKEGGDWTGEGGVSLGGAERKKEPSFKADWLKNRRRDRAPNGIQA